MKPFVFRFSVALLTFCVGAIIASLFLRVPSYPPPTSVSNLSKADAPTQQSGCVEVKFRGFTGADGRVNNAEFLIINGSSEPLYYTGYTRHDTCSYKIQWGSRVYDGLGCDCGTGLERREILPGEQVTITVALASRYYERIFTKEKGKVLVGFDFLTGPSNRKLTVWSNDVS